VGSVRPLAEAAGFHPGSLDIILPVGISFYTFQTLSYTIDVYCGRIKANDSLLDFAPFVGFFPQLVAGPIVRASHFLPQLGEDKPLTRANAYLGFQRLVQGMFKKVFLADRLAMFSDHVFANAGAYDWATTWLAAVAYSLQIYFDFSGYSDMTIGTARIMGYDLGENFDFPYLSRSPREFWRRWHISLSTWIRDYICIPLGGSLASRGRTVVNVLVPMLLCGLWHGAAWTFVAWGGLHGLALVCNRAFARRSGGSPAEGGTSSAGLRPCSSWSAAGCWSGRTDLVPPRSCCGRCSFPRPGWPGTIRLYRLCWRARPQSMPWPPADDGRPCSCPGGPGGIRRPCCSACCG
jgi:alginate O-acetyltransferase complex protein AlgI